MLLLPANLAPVAEFADKAESGARWAVTGVQVESLNDGKDYAVVATDTTCLVVVEGPNYKDPTEYPLHGALVDAKNGATKTLIPAKVFSQVMKDAAKGTKRCTKPILKRVACIMHDGEPAVTEKKMVSVEEEDGTHLEEREVTVKPAGIPEVVLGWTNLEQEASPKTRVVEGRFPPYRDIIPKHGRYTIALDPEFLIRAGKTLEQMKGLKDPENCRVEVSFTSNEKPIIMKMHNAETEQKTTILIMPLAGGCNYFDEVATNDTKENVAFWQNEASKVSEEARAETVRADMWERLYDELAKELTALKEGATSPSENS